MPIYEFVCEKCEDKTPMQYLMKMSESDVEIVSCWVCQSDAHKVVSRSSFECKGGGWFSSGYSKSE